MRFLVKENRVHVFGFVIMPNHIHILWQMQQRISRADVQRDFLKYTAQQIKFDLEKHHPQVLEKFRVHVKDRKYQIWEHRPLSVDLFTKEVLLQKLDYIRNNPIQEKWRLSDTPENYFYSSAKFYICNEDDWGFITPCI
ncbi:MAG: transposase [Cytophagaceae bacterium]|nr:transposase [Cytophagaceae bacterium]MDW8456856.1 transposase [Cytophagaceae bacterium]